MLSCSMEIDDETNCLYPSPEPPTLPPSLLAEESPVQSPARPFGLDTYAPVHLAGSDGAANAFQTNQLPSLLTLVNQTLNERSSL